MSIQGRSTAAKVEFLAVLLFKKMPRIFSVKGVILIYGLQGLFGPLALVRMN
jgi:hypothetical protein